MGKQVMENKTIRQHLKDLTDAYSHIDEYLKFILDDCEVFARNGHDRFIAKVDNSVLEDTIHYLVTTARLTVNIIKSKKTYKEIEISWGDEKR